MARALKKVIDRTTVNANIDTQWFKNVLRDLNLSQREYEMRVDAAVGHASRLFRGMKRFTSQDAERFCRVTGADLTEVVRRAGGLDESDLPDTRAVPVAGWVDPARRVHVKGLAGPRRVVLPPDMAQGTIALRYQTRGANLDAVDGAVIYCRPLGPFDHGMLDRWCYVQLPDGTKMIRVIKRGSSSRAFNLWNDGDVTANAKVESASVVEWMQF